MERLMREAEEVTVHNRRELEVEQIFLKQGVTASQASASREADLCVMKVEQDNIWIDLDTDSDKDCAPPAPPPRRRRRTRHFL
ncbi:Nitrate reductase (NADH) [Hordeum vulgare]|nr:Nitrate reductase (NADH) [Hordeum vulgare]